jgi:hypothetical protein
VYPGGNAYQFDAFAGRPFVLVESGADGAEGRARAIRQRHVRVALAALEQKHDRVLVARCDSEAERRLALEEKAANDSQ